MTIRKILNRILWDSRYSREDYAVFFTHRGAPMDQRIISFPQIKGIQPSWFTYINEYGNETTIPFHRIQEIRNIKTGEVIWRK